MRTSPCGWPLVFCGACPELDDLATTTVTEPYETLRDVVEGMAVEYLWRFTGRRFGVCDTTVRPARQDCHPSTFESTAGFGFTPVLVGGVWRNVACGVCGDDCACQRLYSVRLPGPIQAITEVLVDGDVVPASAYRVDDRDTLVRIDGEDWPLCNDLSLAPTEPGTWQVEYTFGTPVPDGGRLAAAVLACELAKAVCRSSDCRLPQRIQTLTREGVTVGFIDPFEGLEDGRTGLWSVDAWVASITRVPQRSTVHSPDRPRNARATS